MIVHRQTFKAVIVKLHVTFIIFETTPFTLDPRKILQDHDE